ncbi:MAG: hypothetical protein NUV92_05570 [Ignavibacteria bacterium]|jgi:hypothetical protein|nr:hypothetical protein [Ignavibacteria bacterium]MDH7527493.1 hypothetical protein [Ignavibacteria bacterium]
MILIIESEKKLKQWIETNGFAGYDPYDLYSQVPHFRKVIYSKNFFIKNSVSKMYGILDKFFPLLLRRVFRVKKTINSKGMALLGLGYIFRYLNFREEKDLQKVYQISEWLLNNRNKIYPGFCWGYPFDWQSRIFIPEGTPSVVVSYAVGEFFLKAFELTNEKKFFDVVLGVCKFITEGLNKTKLDDDKFCFSYTPIDNFQVHNANLFAAEFLIRIGITYDIPDYIELGLAATKFTLSQQLPNGSLNYWGNEQNYSTKNKNDHYHVGFEIRLLSSIGKLTNNDVILKSAEKYYNFYINNLIYHNNQEFIPKMYPEKTFPLDIHACAESIILNTRLFELFSNMEFIELANKLSIWIINNMQNKNGSFSYCRWKYLNFYYNVKIPYLRWGQAWMFYALNYLIYNLNRIN